MTLINVNSLIANVKESLDLRPEESRTFLEYLLQLTTLEVSKKFSSLFHEEDSLDSDSDGVIELPVDTFRVLSIITGLVEVEPISMRKYNIYTERDISFGTVIYGNLKQSTDKVELRLIPKGSYTDVKVVYQTFNDGAGNITSEYEEVLFHGVRYRYLMTKKLHDKDSIAMAKNAYDEKLDALTFEQNQMYPESRTQYYWEKTWEQNFQFQFFNETRDW
jgi:hypothetical protein